MNFIDEPFSGKDENLEPGELLEECWFFGNLLDKKKGMSRSYSDPCTSANCNQEILAEKSYQEIYAWIKKLSQGANFDQPGLVRTPSMPENGSDGRRNKAKRHGKSNSFVPARSLPTCLGMEEVHDEESEFSMGKLIRQASLKHSDMVPPRIHDPKVLNSRPDKRSIEEDEAKNTRALCFSEGWLAVAQNSAPPIPKWAGKRSTEDMKAQIKFWARAVASNVRQEC